MSSYMENISAGLKELLVVSPSVVLPFYSRLLCNAD